MVEFFKNIFSSPRALPDMSDELSAYNAYRNVKDKSAICFAPSVNMLFSQTGGVQICCHNTEYFIGKYPEQSISEIWSSKKAEALRQQMLNYKLPKSCKICQSDIEMGEYDEVRARQFDTMTGGTYPAMMEFLLSNTCNLECVMCKGEFSSLIRQNREKLPPIQSPYDDLFVEQLREFIPHLRETRFSGSGEAFMIDLNYKIWELIIELNPKCVIMIQTNGTVLNERIKNLLSRGNFQIGVSLDSVRKEVFEKIRIHAKFDRVLENIKYFTEYSKSRNRKFSLALCVMRQNWQELPEFIRFANAHHAFATFHKVWHPLEYSLNTLPQADLEGIEAFLEDQDTLPVGTAIERHNARHYDYMRKSISVWRQKAQKFHPDGMSTQELRDRITDRALAFFEESRINQQVLTLTFPEFRQKFDDLVRAFDGDSEFERRVLILLNYERFSKIYGSFETVSVEQLLDMARKHA